MLRTIAPFVLLVPVLFLPLVTNQAASSSPSEPPPVSWTHLSTINGDLPAPSASRLQTAALIFDIDKDGVNDFVIASQREAGAAVVWYQRQASGWTKHLIDDSVLFIEAGGASHDIDSDGDLDLILGGDRSSNQIWWWENPYPNYEPNQGWTRRLIKDSGASKHHDQIFADIDGDGQAELVFWNQRGTALLLAEIPADPRTSGPWPATPIYTWRDGAEHEGLAQADIDGDGKIDLVGGGRWFKHEGGTVFTPQVIDDQNRFSRVAVGQLKPGGRPEVVLGAGDVDGPLKWYEWDGSRWLGHDLLDGNIRHGHSLAIADFNGDGALDIFAAEMRLDGQTPDARSLLFLGDGAGNFYQSEVATGFGNHESKVGDLDGDGDPDILGKPYNWMTPRLDIWLNNSNPAPCQSLDQWQRHVIDAAKPWRSLFVAAADLDGDGRQDIITGGWWYRNPGVSGQTWSRQPIGDPFYNLAAVYDFDGDGDVDLLGTGGQGSNANATFAWAQNDGAGNFTVHTNLAPASGDFLQGVAVGRWQSDGPLEVALSWHRGSQGVQSFTVPADPANSQWPWRQLATVSQDEALSAGDIDRDGDSDLLLGTQWLRNAGGTPLVWEPLTLFASNDSPDRNRLVDMNGDGRLDAVLTYETASPAGKVAWYEQPADTTASWTEHLIATIYNPLSLDVVDLDGDDDWDVVAGEHNLGEPASARLLVFENQDGTALNWREQLVYKGDEHHDGAQVVDIDGDGDLDILSIGWEHSQLLLYENTATACPGGQPTLPTETAAPTATLAAPVTPAPTATLALTVTPAPTITPTATLPPPPVANCGQSGLQALYTFGEGSGAVIQDVSGVGDPLPLVIADTNQVAWLPDGGLAIRGPTLIASAGAATKLVEASQASNALTVEAWVKPASTNQTGPARIVTLSQDHNQRNFTLGQGLGRDESAELYDMRLRTSATDPNGAPSLTTPPGTVAAELTHVVYTHAADGQRKLYLNGLEVAGDVLGGDFAGWNPAYPLALANELTGGRPWLGDYYQVAIYNCVFSTDEVTAKLEAGPGNLPNQSPTASFTANPVNGTAPLLVTFDASASHDPDGAIQGYSWGFGDGALGEGVTVSHEYAATGIYTATLVVTDDKGATAARAVRLIVDPAPAPLPLTILQEPADLTVREGEPALFTVQASAPAPLSYQWQRNGVDLPGANSASYQLPAASASDGGARFTCVVSNGGEQVTSREALLTVLPAQPAAAQLLYLPLVRSGR